MCFKLCNSYTLKQNLWIDLQAVLAGARTAKLSRVAVMVTEALSHCALARLTAALPFGAVMISVTHGFEWSAALEHAKHRDRTVLIDIAT